jgi:hypothetical protein
MIYISFFLTKYSGTNTRHRNMVSVAMIMPEIGELIQSSCTDQSLPIDKESAAEPRGSNSTGLAINTHRIQ